MSAVDAEPIKRSRSLPFLSTEVSVALTIIVGATLIRVLLAGLVGLGVDESYMVGVSRQFQWSYFDHPPLHVWLVGGWAKLFGEQPLVVRMPFIALFAGSSWLMFALTRSVYGARAGLWALTAFTLAPVFTLSSGSWVLPDGPMVFFLLLAAHLAIKALASRPGTRAALLFWLGAGLAAGLALLSKYLAGALFLGLGLHVLTTARLRHWLTRPEPWLGIAVAALVFTPVLAWNIGNHFASFSFQSGRGTPEAFRLTWFVQGFGGQLVYLLPWIGVALVVEVLRHAWSRKDIDRLFVWLSAPLIVFFFGLSMVSKILPHWPMAGWLFAFPLLGKALAHHAIAYPLLVRRVAGATALALGLFLAVAATQAVSGWIGRYTALVLPKDPTIALIDWRVLEPVLAESGLKPGDFVATGHWIDAGKTNYAIGRRAPVLCLCDDARSFAFLHKESDFVGHDAILVARNAEIMAALSQRFESVQPLREVALTRAGVPVHALKVVRGIRLKPRP